MQTSSIFLCIKRCIIKEKYYYVKYVIFIKFKHVFLNKFVEVHTSVTAYVYLFSLKNTKHESEKKSVIKRPTGSTVSITSRQADTTSRHTSTTSAQMSTISW